MDGLEVELLGRKGDNNLELRLGPPGERRDDRPYACEGGFDVTTGDLEQFYGCSQNQKRTKTCNTSTVGWPPVASFRKNITGSCLRRRQTTEPEESSFKEEISKDHGNASEHAFVKVYMDGYPIGRKIDLRAYDGYEKLSFAINDLFKGLLSDENTGEASFDEHASKGEHTLVYEDNEGDRILVGDVPWKMFVSTAKKLRVLELVRGKWKMMRYHGVPCFDRDS